MPIGLKFSPTVSKGVRDFDTVNLTAASAVEVRASGIKLQGQIETGAIDVSGVIDLAGSPGISMIYGDTNITVGTGNNERTFPATDLASTGSTISTAELEDGAVTAAKVDATTVATRAQLTTELDVERTRITNVETVSSSNTGRLDIAEPTISANTTAAADKQRTP